MAMFASQARYQPIPTGSRSDLESALRVVRQHAIQPLIDRTFAFSEAHGAFEHFINGRPFGKVVIRH